MDHDSDVDAGDLNSSKNGNDYMTDHKESSEGEENDPEDDEDEDEDGIGGGISEMMELDMEPATSCIDEECKCSIHFEMDKFSWGSIAELDDHKIMRDIVATRRVTQVHPQVSAIKTSPTATIVYNDMKSELCLHMILQSMFLTWDETFILTHEFAAASKCRHNLSNFIISQAFVQAVIHSFHHSFC